MARLARLAGERGVMRTSAGSGEARGVRPMTTPDGSAVPPRTRGCLGRLVGCVGIVGAFAVAAILAVTVLPGAHARLIRYSIKPGMSVEEVVEVASGWLSCRAYCGPLDKRTVEIQVWPTSYGPPWSEPQRTFSTKAEMARALAADMRRQDAEWTMTFGYTTMIPKRIYFDVDFAAAGRAKRVSATRWGRLD